MNFQSAFKNTLDKFTNSFNTRSTFTGGNDFLRYGNRNRLQANWSDVEVAVEDFYRGYSYAVIQKRGNKVASLALSNLKTYANPKTVDEFQKREEAPYHPYLTVIEDSVKFTEKQFWKNISIYLDLAGRYYLGVIRTKIGTSNTLSDVKEFVMLNPYEIRRVVNSQGELAGYIENKKDGRYREWPVYQIIEMRELNPFNPDDGQWAMVDAAKDAVFTLREGGDYTRQSLHGNIDAPGIITTDVILDDESFANFRARVTQHTKGEPLFGNGTGAIKWESMQVDLDKAALMDINNMNREELFAVSGTSKTTLGIEQSGTTRETARVQNENFASDTAQPRLEDIIGYLNLDYKRYYQNTYDLTEFSIIVESAVSRDYYTELNATQVRQAQLDLALNLMNAKYTPESSYQYAVGEIELSDLELQSGYDLPETGEQTGQNTGEGGQEDGQSGDGNDPSGPDTPQTPEAEVNNSIEAFPESQGWVGARVEPIEVTARLGNLKKYLYKGDLQEETTNVPGEKNPHYTVVYGLNEAAFETPDIDINETIQENLPKKVIVNDIITFEKEDYNIIVAELVKTQQLQSLNTELLNLGSYPQEFDRYRPHVTLCYIDKEANPNDFIEKFRYLIGSSLLVTGYDIDNPFREVQDNAFDENTEIQEAELEDEIDCPNCHQKKIADFVNELGELEGQSLKDAYDVLLGEITSVQKDAINLSSKNVTVNSFTESDLADDEQREWLLKCLKKAFKKYWWFIVPLFGQKAIKERNNEYDEDFTFTFNDEIQNKILDEVGEVAEGHLNTIFKDILDTANRAFTDVVREAAVDLILTAYRQDPSRFVDYFFTEPDKVEITKAIDTTDILEKNRKLYDRAYDLATEGYNRQEIIDKIQGEYDYLSQVRANTIAANETARAFTQSQYEADYQFLQNTGNLTTAYKELFSRTGDPCRYCQAIIDKGPIPFTSNFLNKGESITIEENGKVHTFTANYEAISAGVVHVNCHCSYRLLLNYKAENSASKGNGGNPNHDPETGRFTTGSGGLSKDEESAVEWYVSGEGQWINQELREGKDTLSEEEKKKLADLMTATDREVSYEKLYRGVDADTIFGSMSNLEYSNLQDAIIYGDDPKGEIKSKVEGLIGKEIEEKGFMSTSKNKDVALDYRDFAELERSIVMEIDTGGSVKGLDLKKYMPKLDERMEQEEVILHPNFKYKISDISRYDDEDFGSFIYVKVKASK